MEREELDLIIDRIRQLSHVQLAELDRLLDQLQGHPENPGPAEGRDPTGPAPG